MKIAFVGKGGSGKTTLSSLFIRHLATRRVPVVAVDADINQHLGAALGLAEAEAAALPAMGAQLPLIKDYLRGTNPRLRSAETMIKTTPPGAGSRLLRITEDNPVYDACARTVSLDGGDVRLLATGPFSDADLGVACYHSKTGAVELCLNHLVDGREEFMVVDMTAGSDSFASGMFTRFDMTFLVAEPTRKGVSVYRQYKEYARDFGVPLRVVGNKVQGADDVDFLRDEVGDDLLVTFGHSDWVRAMEKGSPHPLTELEEVNRSALHALWETADGAYERRDWERYTRQMVHFHLRNAESWGNEKTGTDLAGQVDPTFVLHEQAAAQPV
ncbi:MAG: ATP-binding protein [Streptomyces sp.]|uniref:ATP-binding protein n=1 Tax=Streptomyces sp. TaxID=1931 RepID=UPI003D6A3E89